MLDWLATWFVEHDWSIKQLNRLILTSSVYRQSSLRRAECAEIDPQNALYWRFPPRRLEFEELRDSLLAAAGRLEATVGGRPVDPETDASRRSLYLYVDRYDLPDVYRAFDFADPEFSTAERESTIVPQQALYFMNHPWVMDRARDLAERTAGIAAQDDATRIRASCIASCSSAIPTLPNPTRPSPSCGRPRTTSIAGSVWPTPCCRPTSSFRSIESQPFAGPLRSTTRTARRVGRVNSLASRRADTSAS